MFIFTFYNCKRWLNVVGSMFWSDNIGSKKRIMKHEVNVPIFGQLESEVGWSGA